LVVVLMVMVCLLFSVVGRHAGHELVCDYLADSPLEVNLSL
jgi:hypothetical protein